MLASLQSNICSLQQTVYAVCQVTLLCFGGQALERVAGLLEGSSGSVTVAERGDLGGVPRHPNFRLLAAMNPATDAGKRDLPAPLRNRFTEARNSCCMYHCGCHTASMMLPGLQQSDHASVREASNSRCMS